MWDQFIRVQWDLFYKPNKLLPGNFIPIGTASIGDVKTIRTLRSDAPLTVSDMKGAICQTKQSRDWESLLRACLDGLRQTQYGLLWTPFPSAARRKMTSENAVKLFGFEPN